MRTRVSAALNGIELGELDDSILIQRVVEPTPSWNVNATGKATLIGQRYTGTEQRTRDVQVLFAIREMRDYARRDEVLDAVRAWAAPGGELSLNYKGRKRLRVICSAMPAVNGIDQWAENYTVTFRAVEQPLWENMDPDVANLSARTSGSATLAVRGSAGGKLCVEAKNTSGSTCNAVTVTANGRSISFATLALANNETLVMDYDEREIQRLRIKNSGGVLRSVIAKRTEASADDILLNAGTNTVTVSSGAALTWKLYTYGRWQG